VALVAVVVTAATAATASAEVCKPAPTAATVGRPAGLPAPTVIDDDVHTTHDGQVFDNVEFRGRVYVDHHGVVIRNSRLIGDQYYAVYATADDNNFTIERSDLNSGMAVANGTVIRDVHVSRSAWSGDGLNISADDVLVDHVLIDGLFGGYDDHLDGIQVMSGRRVTIRDSWVDASAPLIPGPTGGDNAAIFFSADLGPISDASVTCTTMIPGNASLPEHAGYTLRIYDVTGTVRVGRNRFGRLHDFGPVDLRGLANTPAWCDNRYLDGPEVEVNRSVNRSCTGFPDPAGSAQPATPTPTPTQQGPATSTIPAPTSPRPASPGGVPHAPGPSAPALELRVPARGATLRAVRRGGLRLQVTTPVAGIIDARAVRTTRTLLRAHRRAAATTTVLLRTTAAGRAALRAHRTLRLRVRVTLKPASGTSLTTTLALTLRR
jgi:hypothetical protein